MLGQFSAIASLVLAEAAPVAAPQTPSLWTTFLPFLPILPLFYLLILRPQQEQERKRKAMIASMSKGDEVLTGAGIYGTVVSIDADNDRVVLRVDDDKNVRMAFSRSSIVRVFESGSSRKKDKEKVTETTSG